MRITELNWLKNHSEQQIQETIAKKSVRRPTDIEWSPEAYEEQFIKSLVELVPSVKPYLKGSDTKKSLPSPLEFMGTECSPTMGRVYCVNCERKREERVLAGDRPAMFTYCPSSDLHRCTTDQEMLNQLKIHFRHRVEQSESYLRFREAVDSDAKRLSELSKARRELDTFNSYRRLEARPPLAMFTGQLVDNLKRMTTTAITIKSTDGKAKRSKTTAGIVIPLEKGGVAKVTLDTEPRVEFAEGALLFNCYRTVLAVLYEDGRLFDREDHPRHQEDMDSLIDTLRQMDCPPEQFKERLFGIGKRFKVCLRCGQPLTDDQSIKLGMGPTCAKSLK